MKKRVLSFLVVLAMVLSMTPVITLPAAAATAADVDAWIAQNDAAFNAGENLPTVCPVCSAENVEWSAITEDYGGIIYADSAIWRSHLYLANDVTVTDATYNFLRGYTANGACLYLNDSTLTYSGTGAVVNPKAYTINLFGNGNVINNGTANMFVFDGAGRVNIYGGTYTNNSSAGMFENNAYAGGQTVHAMIYGGTFNVNPETYDADMGFTRTNVVIADGVKAMANGNGTWKVAEPVCPGCGAKNVEWETYTGQHTSAETALTSGTKHYRLAADYKYDGYGFYMTGGTVCFDLGAYNLARGKNEGSAFYVGAGTLTITGTGTVVGSRYAAVRLGSGAATVNLKGGTFTKYVTQTGGYVTTPIINLEAGGTVNMYSGAVITADECRNTQFGCVSMIGNAENKAVFNMYGGKIVADDPATGTAGNGRDGTKYPGGAINVGRPSDRGNAELNVSGGEIWGDTLTEANNVGGTIYVAAGNKVTVSGNAVIKGGNAPLGGNIYLAPNATLELSGTAQITGGVATSNGGNVYAAEATVKMTGGSMTDGTANRGGNVYLSASAMEMSGGTISGGNKADQKVEANVTLRDTSTLKMTGGTIQSLDAPTGVGSAVAIRAGGKLILGGTAQIVTQTGALGNSNATKLVYASAGTVDQIQIAADWTGSAYIHDGTSYTDGTILNCGQWGSFDNEGNFTAGGAVPFTGDLHLMARVIRGDKQGNLVAANVTVVNGETETWYANGELAVEAINALGDTKAYIQAKGVGVELPITGKTYVNNNGYTVTVTGNGTLYGMDTTMDGYEGNGGSFLVADTVTVARDVTYGNRYISLNFGVDMESGYAILKVQPLDMKLTSVTLRAGKSSEGMGLYYKATLSMPETLAGRIQTYGVVLSLVDMPGADFASEGNQNGFTSLSNVLPVSAENGYTVTINSGSVFGIMKEDASKAESNVTRGEMPIYANAYVYIDFDGDGRYDADEFVMADTDTDTTNDVAWSLKDVLDTIDGRWSDFEAAQQKVTEFYSFWSDYGMNAWSFNNIKKA